MSAPLKAPSITLFDAENGSKTERKKSMKNEQVDARVVPFATRLLGNHLWYKAVIVKAASASLVLRSGWAVIGLKSR